jgi:hypothetical protein
MRFLKQSTSVDLPIGPFLDDTDGKTAETALTITQPDIRLKKNGSNWAQKNAAQTLSHEENGYYEVTLDATDTDTLGQLLLAVHESGALPVWHEFMVMPANVWDSMFGADRLQVDVQEMAAGVVTATVIADNAIDAASIATGAITAAKFAAGAIDAAAIAADAIGASELAADAVAEIQSGLATAAALATVQADTDNIQARLPAALVGGRMDASVGAMAPDVVTASAVAADAVAEIQAGLSTLDGAGVRAAVGLAAANLDTQLAAIDDAVDTEVAAIKAKTDLLPASPAATGDAMTLTAGERNAVADALLDRADGVETGVTVRQSLRLANAANGGKTNGGGTSTFNVRDLADTKNRVVATVDADGNRSVVTRDLT